MRGGVSSARSLYIKFCWYSPHAWGCFQILYNKPSLTRVFPTCVVVFLSIVFGNVISISIPHMRGSVSCSTDAFANVLAYSPHAWGCFSRLKVSYVAGNGIPHMRGGVSNCRNLLISISRYSPHAWGCFLSTPSSLPIC